MLHETGARLCLVLLGIGASVAQDSTAASCIEATDTSAYSVHLPLVEGYGRTAIREGNVSLTLSGDALIDDCGLHLDGEGDHATVSNFDYSSDGAWTIGFWVTKERCTPNPYEYIYSHDTRPDGFAFANVPSINVYLGCLEDQNRSVIDEMFMRTVIISDDIEAIMFDVHLPNALTNTVATTWLSWTLAVSPTGLAVAFDGTVLDVNEALTTWIVGPTPWNMHSITYDQTVGVQSYNPFGGGIYTGSSLFTDVFIGSRTDGSASRFLRGKIAGVLVSTSTLCPYALHDWFMRDETDRPCLLCDRGEVKILGACERCPSGTFADFGYVECSSCDPGQADLDNSSSTPCTTCPAGQFLDVPNGTVCVDSGCQPGFAGPEGATSAQCVRCAAGTTDDNSDGASRCTLCPSGRFSAAEGLTGNCTGLCPVGFHAPQGSVEQTSETLICVGFGTVTVKVDVVFEGSEMAWYFDENNVTRYTDAHNGRSFTTGAVTATTGSQVPRYTTPPLVHKYSLAYDKEHTFTFTDAAGNGWYGGWWELLNACGDTIGGGPDNGGIVSGLGGTYSFSGTDLCCETACGPCPPGRSDHDSNSRTRCVACASGRYSTGSQATGQCPNVCPPGSYAPRGATSSDQCLQCLPGQYDEYECDFDSQQSASHTYSYCPPGSENCKFNVGQAEDEDACMSLILHHASWANGAEWRTNSGDVTTDGQCYALVGWDGIFVVEDSADGYSARSCMFYRSAGTPCVLCPAGRFSVSTTVCDRCPEGRYAPPGSASPNACETCVPGRVDSDLDPATPCVPCPPATFSNTTARSGSCDPCPLGSTSPMGSLELSDCNPTVDGKWAECQPCASKTAGKVTTDGDTLGIFASSPMPFCVNRMILKVFVPIHGSEVSWEFGYTDDVFGNVVDTGEMLDQYIDDRINQSVAHMYSDDDNGNAHFHIIDGLSLAQHHHTLHFNDAWGDGWHGGFWHLQNACGGTIGGGPTDGLVIGFGGAFNFSTAEMCCECRDDPDGILASQYTACPSYIGRVNGDCEADVSNFIGVPGMLAKHLCPVTCRSCNAEALDTTQRTCGLCPLGYGLDDTSNTYEDLDECAHNNGGCDPLMGYYQGASWRIEPCINTQGSFRCNSCPEGFEQAGTSCRLPGIAYAENGTQVASLFNDVANVQPKTTLCVAGPVAVLVTGSNEQAEFLEAVRADIAASLEVELSDIVVDNIGGARRLRHRRLEDTVELQFDLLFVGSHSQAFVSALIAQLEDLASPLRSANTTSWLLVDQVPSITFVCPIGKVRPTGESLCRKCPAPMHADKDGVTCLDCPAGQIPTARGDACQCDDGYYSAQVEQLICFDDEFDQDVVAENTALRGSEACLACPTTPIGEPCAVCDTGDAPVVMAGFRERRDLLPSGEYRRFAFRCGASRVPQNIIRDRCPASEFHDTSFNRWVHKCGGLYDGELCLSCLEGNHHVGDRCEECAARTTTPIFWFALTILGGFAFLSICSPCHKTFREKKRAQISNEKQGHDRGIASFLCPRHSNHVRVAMRSAFQPFRIAVTYMQITSQVGPVLRVMFPDVFAEIVELCEIANLWDYLVDAECAGLDNFKKRWIVTVVILPAILFGCTLMHFMVKRVLASSRKEKDNAATQLQSNWYFITFFLYPSICNVTFATFICRPMGSKSSNDVLMSDDRMRCGTPEHARLTLASFIVMGAFCFGLPSLLGYTLLRKAREYESNCSKSGSIEKIVADRVAQDFRVSLDAAKYIIRDIAMSASFSFITDAYRPRVLYWEALDMVRKLTLVGLVVLVGRGTPVQLAIAIILSFFFFSLQLSVAPYKLSQDNIFRASTECHVFLVLLVALVMRTEALSYEDSSYDWVLSVTFILLVPGAFVATVMSKARFALIAQCNTDVDASFNRFRLGLAIGSDCARLSSHFEHLRSELEPPGQRLWRTKQIVTHLEPGQLQAILSDLQGSLPKSQALGFHFTDIDSARLILHSAGIRASTVGQLGGGVSVCLKSPISLGWTKFGGDGFAKRVGEELWGSKWREVMPGPAPDFDISAQTALCKELVRAIYHDRNPEKLRDVDYLLHEYLGRENELLELLREKYGVQGQYLLQDPNKDWGKFANKLEVLLVLRSPSQERLDRSRFVPGRPSVYIVPRTSCEQGEGSDVANVYYPNRLIERVFILRAPDSIAQMERLDVMMRTATARVRCNSTRDAHGGMSDVTVVELNEVGQKGDTLTKDPSRPWCPTVSSFTATVATALDASGASMRTHLQIQEAHRNKQVWPENVARFSRDEMAAAVRAIDDSVPQIYSLAYFFTSSEEARELCKGSKGIVATAQPNGRLGVRVSLRSPAELGWQKNAGGDFLDTAGALIHGPHWRETAGKQLQAVVILGIPTDQLADDGADTAVIPETLLVTDPSSNGKLYYSTAHIYKSYLLERTTTPADRNSQNLDKDMRALFAQVDANGDGHVTKTEATHYLRKARQVDLDSHSIDIIFGTLDQDGNGKLDISEFPRFVEVVEKEIARVAKAADTLVPAQAAVLQVLVDATGRQPPDALLPALQAGDKYAPQLVVEIVYKAVEVLEQEKRSSPRNVRRRLVDVIGRAEEIAGALHDGRCDINSDSDALKQLALLLGSVQRSCDGDSADSGTLSKLNELLEYIEADASKADDLLVPVPTSKSQSEPEKSLSEVESSDLGDDEILF